MVLYIGIAALGAWCISGVTGPPIRPLGRADAHIFECAGRPNLADDDPMGLSHFLRRTGYSFCTVACLPSDPHKPGKSRSSIFLGQNMICVMCLTAAAVNTGRQIETAFPPTATLATERGSIHVSEHLAAQYQAAIDFMKVQNALANRSCRFPKTLACISFQPRIARHAYLLLIGRCGPAK